MKKLWTALGMMGLTLTLSACGQSPLPSETPAETAPASEFVYDLLGNPWLVGDFAQMEVSITTEDIEQGIGIPAFQMSEELVRWLQAIDEAVDIPVFIYDQAGNLLTEMDLLGENNRSILDPMALLYLPGRNGDIIVIVENLGMENTHTVVAGETLWSIAQAWGITVEQLQEANQLAADTEIFVGQNLLIEGATRTPEPATLMIEGHLDVNYPHPFGNEMDNVVLNFLPDTEGVTIVIDINETVQNVQLVPLLFMDRGYGNYNFTQVDAPISQAAEVLADQVIMIHNWLDTGGSAFSQGLIFTDADGNRRTFAFGIDNKEGGLRFVEVVDGF